MSAPAEPTNTQPASTEPDTTPDAARPQETDWEAEARKWEKRSKDNFAKLKEAEPKLADYERIVEANKTAEQRQAEELTRWQSEAETWRKTAVGSRIEAMASLDFADPSDAVGQLDPATYLGAGGQIDDARIKSDLADLLERKPHWRRTPDAAPGPRTPAPNKAQGSSATPPPVTPADQFAAIIQAQRQRA
jgi:hypothetical protein